LGGPGKEIFIQAQEVGDEMLVREVMRKDVLTANPEAPIQEAARTMVDNHVGSLVVVRKGIVQGIVTERDLMKVIAEGMNIQGEVSEIMTHYVYAVAPQQKIKEAIKIMKKHKIKKLPVMEGRSLAGILTATDILASHPELIEELKLLVRKK
jgi:CBS domain-containing protein